MKKTGLVILALSVIISNGLLAADRQKGRHFPKRFPFSHGFSDKQGFFVGNPGWWEDAPYFPGYYPYYPHYYPPEDRYKGKYESPYPTEIKTAGRLAIEILPRDAEVLLNGRILGHQERGGFFDIGLLTGSYKVEARKQGYRQFHQEIEIKTAATTNLKIILEGGD
jgi:hypothetical protein